MRQTDGAIMGANAYDEFPVKAVVKIIRHHSVLARDVVFLSAIYKTRWMMRLSAAKIGGSFDSVGQTPSLSSVSIFILVTVSVSRYLTIYCFIFSLVMSPFHGCAFVEVFFSNIKTKNAVR